MFIKQFDTWLEGKPDTIVTIMLLALSITGIVVALFAPRPLKVMVLAYFALP